MSDETQTGARMRLDNSAKHDLSCSVDVERGLMNYSNSSEMLIYQVKSQSFVSMFICDPILDQQCICCVIEYMFSEKDTNCFVQITVFSFHTIQLK